jgi:serum/glucocorticoid-regulated kinase 2
LEYAFQTEEKVFFVMKFRRGGELAQHLRVERNLSEDAARFYAGSVVLAFEYLHAMKVVYRDLKPENILLDEQGYVKVVDFGLAKQL